MNFRASAHKRGFAVGVLAMLLFVFGLLVACGADNEPTTTSSAGPVTTTGGPGTTTSGETVQVTMKNRTFTPKEITIRTGQTVTWINEDSLEHDVVANNGEFKSDLFGQGETFSFTFTEAGTYPYFCSIHPGMTGTVIVE